MKFNQFGKKSAKLFLITAALGALILANTANVFAQFTFNGDYDRTFGAPNGYVIDPPNQTGIASGTYFVGGVYNPDGTTVRSAELRAVRD